MFREHQNKSRGSILVLSLWLLLLLTVFTVHIGLRIRQRIELVSRIEQRMKLRNLTAAGVKKGIAVIKHCLSLADADYSAYVKSYLKNNEEKFKALPVGQGLVDVSYLYFGTSVRDFERFYGLTDEESKININYADRKTLQRLFLRVVTSDEDEALRLADAIIDWRTMGKSRIEGFWGDDYYAQLQYPYEKKGAAFELMDELLLVQGMDQTVYDRIKPFLTVYGDGAVNINTAPRIVLIALGFSPRLIDKILSVRRGSDGWEATSDDYVFLKPFDIASDMTVFVDLTEQEAREIDALNQAGAIKTNSSFYLIQSIGKLKGQRGQGKAVGVFDSSANRLIYYKEK
jgi:hypothetical protein